MNWSCPNCTTTDVTAEARPHTRYHRCRGMRGLVVPLVPDGVRAKLEVVERGDYVRDEDVQVDGEGRPVMAVVTTRDDGQDCTVYAPCAGATVEVS